MKIKVIVFISIIICMISIGYAYSKTPDIKYYQDGDLINSDPNYYNDVKMVLYNNDYKVITDYPSGYCIKIPEYLNEDYKMTGIYNNFYSDDMDIKISKEKSPYLDTKWYIENYLNKYILNDTYRKENDITLLEYFDTKINGYEAVVISFNKEYTKLNILNEYMFVYIITDQTTFYNFLIKTDSLKEKGQIVSDIINSFKAFTPVGGSHINLKFTPNTDNFNTETKEYYQSLLNKETIDWGFFTPGALGKNNKKLEDIEKYLGYKFPVILDYKYLNEPFPMVQMEKAYREDRIVELTMQATVTYNDGRYKKNTCFDIIEGKYDNEIKEFASQAKKFGHPFLFRLNNEMNSDWCEYSGIALLSDSDLYKAIWIKIFNMFKEEGVDNAIWIFNPNDKNYPPVSWNSHLAYFPGEEYVHMIGLTGYNTGDYYRHVTGEIWRNFNDIYMPLTEEYSRYYNNYPWIITEFATSSVGGDKAKWIEDMFINISRYPQIKIAVWWSYADFDYREGREGIPSRPYWLEEKAEYLNKFREGLDLDYISKDLDDIVINNDYSIYSLELNDKQTNRLLYCVYKKGKLFVPLRSTAEALGGQVYWDSSINRILVRKGFNTISLAKNSRFAVVNGRCVGVGEDIFLDHGITMIPADFIIKYLDGRYELIENKLKIYY